MSLVDDTYNRILDKMTGAERLQRTSDLYNSIHSMLCHQVRSTDPALTEREVRLRVARILYLSDPHVVKLLDMLR